MDNKDEQYFTRKLLISKLHLVISLATEIVIRLYNSAKIVKNCLVDDFCCKKPFF